jgi:hypothetical protein
LGVQASGTYSDACVDLISFNLEGESPVFRLFNDLDRDIVISRSHKHGDEAPATITVPPGSPFEGSETVYSYQVADDELPCVLTERSESMANRVLRYADAQRQDSVIVGNGSNEAPPADSGDASTPAPASTENPVELPPIVDHAWPDEGDDDSPEG